MALRRVSRRDHLLAVKAQLEGLAVMTGHAPHEYLTRIPAKRGPRKPSRERLEHDAVKDITEWQAQQPDVGLWRNNRGDIELPTGGRMRYGVGPPGASDFIGYVTVVITPEMVGTRIAQFTAIEAKAPRGQPTDDQLKFIHRIRTAGGRAGIARSETDAKEICHGRST